MDIATLPPDKIEAAIARLEGIKEQRAAENKLAGYHPYARQAEFHAAGATHRERLLCAGNQTGKTLAGGFECAMHATGRYPDWWEGKRFDKHTVGWVAGVTGETVRDTVQRVLIGRTGEIGQGAIPKDAIADLVPSRGVPELMDLIRVRHVSGGLSTIGLKSYEKGREKFQGETLDYVWCDEEPPSDVYSEALTRTNVGGGPVWITFTPLQGMSEVVRRFLTEKSPDRTFITMTIDDALHFTDDQRKQIADSYLPHEREARVKGVPVLGSGRIFPVSEEMIAIEPLKYIPPHWCRLGALDFGYDHPAAAVELVWDRDADVVYIIKAWRERQTTPVLHAAALSKRSSDRTTLTP
jgi:phage terminase large subunit-like protein